VILLPARNCGQPLEVLPAEGGYGQASVTEASDHALVLVLKALPSIKQKVLVASEVSGLMNVVMPTPVPNLKFRVPIRFMKLMRVESLLRVEGWLSLKRKSVRLELSVCNM